MNATSTRPVRSKPVPLVRDELEATPWAQSFVESAPVSYKQAIEFAQQPNLRVFLRHTDENGKPQWAICVEDEPEFWMDALDTRSEAVVLCKAMNWKIVTP